ncbi:RNA-dependent RNA polymerase 2-like [Henckelia pumila]|uniref:RNA-dependent RNA polymerase 2-like n=1 Tax=Henckelia pumila TaxID=405737 RepID=UPI003C6E8A91
MGTEEKRPTLTARVTNIPHSAIAQELFTFLESLLGKGEIFAIDISTEHKNWKSRGHGRVQFDTPETNIKALSLSQQRKLYFRGAHLTLSHSFEDIIIRPVDPNNRVENAGGLVLLAGIMSRRDCMGILESWDEVKLWVSPEKRRLEFFLKQNGECYKLEVGFGDVLETQGCCFGGNEQNADAILLKENGFLNSELRSSLDRKIIFKFREIKLRSPLFTMNFKMF